MAELDEDVWEKIRADYEAGKETVVAIACKYGTTARTLYLHAEKDGWTMRAPELSGAMVGAPAARRKLLISKLSALFEQQLLVIEKQGDGPQRLANLERDCHALETLSRAFDRIVQAELRGQPAAARARTASAGAAGKPGEPALTPNRQASQERSDEPASAIPKTQQLRTDLARRFFGLQNTR